MRSGGPRRDQGMEPQVASGWGCPPVGVAYRNTVFWVLVQARPSISPIASSTCRGNPRNGSGSPTHSSASADPFLSTSLGGPDSGGGAAGSDPEGSGEREGSSGLRSGPESQVHSASAHPQLFPNRGIDDLLEYQMEPDDGKSQTPRFGGKEGWTLGNKEPLGCWDPDSWLPKLTFHFFPCRPAASHPSGFPRLFRCAVPLPRL